MARHKTRVTRRGRRSRKGRVGTRKQAGGFSFNPLNWLKKKDPVDPAATEPATTVSEDKPAPPTPPPTPPPTTDPNAPPTEKKGFMGLWGGGSRRKLRKTRHHHRRRHHRK
jgi:hypothetical protein